MRNIFFHIVCKCSTANLRFGQAGRKAIVDSESGVTSDTTLRKVPQVQVEAGEVALTLAKETKSAPVLSKTERLKQAAKDGKVTYVKAIHDHRHILSAVFIIASGMFIGSNALQARALSKNLARVIESGTSTEEEIVAAGEAFGRAAGKAAGAAAGLVAGSA